MSPVIYLTRKLQIENNTEKKLSIHKFIVYLSLLSTFSRFKQTHSVDIDVAYFCGTSTTVSVANDISFTISIGPITIVIPVYFTVYFQRDGWLKGCSVTLKKYSSSTPVYTECIQLIYKVTSKSLCLYTS